MDALSLADALEADADAVEARRIQAEQYQGNPAVWVGDRLGEEIWSMQARIMKALVEHRRVAVQSCHGVGKSHIASRTVAWWIDSHPVEDVFVITTAPTFPQVEAVLWRYINQAHRGGKLPGRTTSVSWKIDDILVAFGRKPADHDPGAFQGIHAQYVLVIIDEACGVPESLWIALDSLTTNPDCRILAIGNPDDPSSHFARVCAPGSLWHRVKISAFDSPNFTGEVVSERLGRVLIGPSWVEEKRDEWGEDNPIYRAKVLGEFSQNDPHKVVRVSDVAACRLSVALSYKPDQLLPVELGVDVGGGGDETVIRERRGVVAGREWRDYTDKPEKIAPMVMLAIRETGATRVKVDSIGVGFGVVGELENMRRRGEHSAEIIAVNVAEKSREPGRFENVRAEMWWEVGRLLSERREWDLSGPEQGGQMENSDTTVAQLLDPRWEVSSTGRIKIESKDDIRARTGRSPDNADALLMAYYTPPGGSAQAFLEALSARR